MRSAARAVVGGELALTGSVAGLDERQAGPDYLRTDVINWMQLPRSEGYLERRRQHEQRTGAPVTPYDR